MLEFTGSSDKAKLFIELPKAMIVFSLNESQRLGIPKGKSIAYGSKVLGLGVEYDRASRVLTIPRGYFAIVVTNNKAGNGYIIKRIDAEMTSKLLRSKAAAKSSVHETMDIIMQQVTRLENKLGPKYQSAKKANAHAIEENMSFAGSMLTDLSNYIVSGALAKYIDSLTSEDDEKVQK